MGGEVTHKRNAITPRLHPPIYGMETQRVSDFSIEHILKSAQTPDPQKPPMSYPLAHGIPIPFLLAHPAVRFIPPFLKDIVKHQAYATQQTISQNVQAPLPDPPSRPGNPNKPAPVKKYKCDVCAKAFSRSNTLVTHKRIHTGEKPFKCEHCGRAFRQPGNLTRHRLTHTTVKPYICSQCGKAFNRASNLHTHIRTHSNYRPYVCPFCAKGFHQKVDMRVHCYSHTGERPYRCEQCHKGFTLASTLTAHRRTHSLVKPFLCEHCGKQFYQRNSLKSHLLASHPYVQEKAAG